MCIMGLLYAVHVYCIDTVDANYPPPNTKTTQWLHRRCDRAVRYCVCVCLCVCTCTCACLCCVARGRDASKEQGAGWNVPSQAKLASSKLVCTDFDVGPKAISLRDTLTGEHVIVLQ